MDADDEPYNISVGTHDAGAASGTYEVYVGTVQGLAAARLGVDNPRALLDAAYHRGHLVVARQPSHGDRVVDFGVIRAAKTMRVERPTELTYVRWVEKHMTALGHTAYPDRWWSKAHDPQAMMGSALFLNALSWGEVFAILHQETERVANMGVPKVAAVTREVFTRVDWTKADMDRLGHATGSWTTLRTMRHRALMECASNMVKVWREFLRNAPVSAARGPAASALSSVNFAEASQATAEDVSQHGDGDRFDRDANSRYRERQCNLIRSYVGVPQILWAIEIRQGRQA